MEINREEAQIVFNLCNAVQLSGLQAMQRVLQLAAKCSVFLQETGKVEAPKDGKFQIVGKEDG